MAAKSGRLDYWRNYFRSADSDIFEVIEYAIVVAASDCPTEFRIRRDGIAEKLFACKFARCTGCDQVELAVPEEEEDGGELKSKFGGSGGRGGSEAGGSGCKDSKVNSSTDEAGEQNQVSNMSYNEGNISYNEVEALTEEIEEKNVTVGEVLRIKEIMENYQAQSDGILFESLRRLQLMELSVGTLKMTEIGKAVNGVRKHASKQIRHLSRTLINEWKDMVDVWVNATAEIAGSSPDSVNPSVVDDGGLPSPPLDEGAFLAAHSTIELSQFFDGMDDDGNIQNSGELERKHKSERKPTFENHAPNRKPQNPREDNARKENQTQMRKQEPINKQSKPSNADLSLWRPVNPTLENKSNRGNPTLENKSNRGNPKFQQRSDAEKIQKKPLNGSQDKSKSADEMLSRLEATKRRLHEGYQQAENAKKQRTIQVMELHDLPKQGLSHRNFHPKPGSHNRHFSNGRR